MGGDRFLAPFIAGVDIGSMTRTPRLVAAVLVVGLVLGCGRPGATGVAIRAEIAAAMERYQVASRTVNPDSMAAFYTPTATLFEPGIEPIVGRDAIRAFLASFPGATVHVATATPDTIEVYGPMALLWGTYFERLDFPGQPTSEQAGKFVAQWIRGTNDAWLIQRMYRIPLPAAAPR